MSKKSKKLAATTTTTEKPENSDDKKQEIPFTFSVPKTSDDLEELFTGRGPKEKAIIGRAHHTFSRILKLRIYEFFFHEIFFVMILFNVEIFHEDQKC